MTAQNVVDKVKLTWPALSDAEVLGYVNDAHTEILETIRLNIETVSQNVTAGTSEYAIDDDILHVWQVRYYRNANDYHVLKATHLDKLNTEEEYWRDRDDDEPQEFYIEDGVIGFTPGFATTTNTGYPVVRYEATRTATLALVDDLPAFVLKDRAWVEATRRDIALVRRDERYSEFKARADRALAQLSASVNKRAADHKPSVKPKTTWWNPPRL